MHISFTPQGDWFVFDDNGKTMERGFKTKDAAQQWIMKRIGGGK